MSAPNQTGERVPAQMFVIGLLLPLALRLAGHLFPAFYDDAVVTFLHQFVLPWLPIVAAGVAILAFLRTESLRTWPVAMLVVGAIVALPLVNDWWYFAPVSFAALVVVGVWQVRVHLWSKHRAAGILAGALIAGALLRAAWDPRGSAAFDSRFGIGIPTRWENALRTGMVLAPLVLLAWWVLRCVRRSAKSSRARLAALLDEDPHCTAWFAATTTLTRESFDPSLDGVRWSPLPSCIPLGGGGVHESSYPKDPRSDWDNLGARGVLWLKKWVWLFRWLRYLRPSVREPGHPSEFVRKILREGADHELSAAQSALFGQSKAPPLGQLATQTEEERKRAQKDATETPLFDYLAIRTEKESESAQEDAKLHFFRHVQFREACIDAEHLLFLPVEAASPTEWRDKAAKAHKQMLKAGAPTTATSARPAVVAEQLQKASLAMLLLWLDVLDWLFFEHGDKFVEHPIAGKGTGLNLGQLTCNVIALRQAAREAAGHAYSNHIAAADLSLWLFIGALREGKEIGKQVAPQFEALRSYIESLTDSIRKGAQIPWAEASLAGAGYALHCLSMGNLVDASHGYVIDRVNLDAEVKEAAWLGRVGGFAKIGSALKRFGTNRNGAEQWCVTTWKYLKDLESVDAGGQAESARLRALHFVLHLDRAAKNGNHP